MDDKMVVPPSPAECTRVTDDVINISACVGLVGDRRAGELEKIWKEAVLTQWRY
jgi:hypothetical protein